MPKPTSRLSALLFMLAAPFLLAGPAPGAPYAKSAAKDASDPVLGYWLTEGNEGAVEIYRCGKEICGRLHWLKDEDLANPPRDAENPDPRERNRPLCGLPFMGGFVVSPVEPGRYEDGWIYSPRDGEMYSARMTLIGHDKLDLHGYVLTPLLGQSQIWIRTRAEPSCRTG